MKRDVMSDALNNISEEYIDEALGLHRSEVVSEMGDMNTKKVRRRFGVAVIAAVLVLAFGVSAYATDLFGLFSKEPEPGETITINYDIADYDEEGNELDTVTHEEVEYSDITKIINLKGPQTSSKVEFKANYLPGGYDTNFGNENDWNSFMQGESERGDYNIRLVYSADLGDDGRLFTMDIVKEETSYTEGEYDIYKLLCADNYDDSRSVYYYLMYNKEKGYMIIVSGSESKEILEEIADGLEIRETGEYIEYNPNSSHDIYLSDGVG